MELACSRRVAASSLHGMPEIKLSGLNPRFVRAYGDAPRVRRKEIRGGVEIRVAR